MNYNECCCTLIALAKGAKPDITPKPVGFGFKKSIPAKDDKVNSPVSPTIPGERSLPQSRVSIYHDIMVLLQCL